MRSRHKFATSVIGIYRSVPALLAASLFFILILESKVTFHIYDIPTSSFRVRGLIRRQVSPSSTFKLSQYLEVVEEGFTNDVRDGIHDSDDIQLQSTSSRQNAEQSGFSLEEDLLERRLLTQITEIQPETEDVIHPTLSDKRMRRFVGSAKQEIVANKALLQQFMPVVHGMKGERSLNRNAASTGNRVEEVGDGKIWAVQNVEDEVNESKTKKDTGKANVKTSPKMQRKSHRPDKSVKAVKAVATIHFPAKSLKEAELSTPPENTTLMDRLRWLKMNWPSFKILHSDGLSVQFSKRMSAFLTGQVTWSRNRGGAKGTPMRQSIRSLKKLDLGIIGVGNKDEAGFEVNDENLEHRFSHSDLGPCKVRFFMTWISSPGSFGPREHLSLESVFRTHPSACLVIISRTLDSEQGRRMLQPFVEKGFRVIAIAPNVPSLLRDTPALKWFEDLKKGKIDPGIISFGQNLSNLLRLAVLYRYGGIYIDSDIILLNDVSYLSNAIGAQSVDKETGEWKRLNNAVMAFNKKHPLLLKFIQEFSLTFNGSKWGHNGPYLVSRVVSRVATRPGYGCKVLPPLAFYPVDWEHIPSFFHASDDESQQKWKMLKLQHLQERSLTIHMWNKQSQHLEIEPTSIMDLIFQQFCVFCDPTILRAALQSQV